MADLLSEGWNVQKYVHIYKGHLINGHVRGDVIISALTHINTLQRKNLYNTKA
ncbi:hypothetical protein [Pseudomonas sp. L1(2025)]|uniref:hypothetical protein n=1 Tax=Pseudomonas sp. L1(2025) TaxID=3449429 RepID=UPI003F692AC5